MAAGAAPPPTEKGPQDSGSRLHLRLLKLPVSPTGSSAPNFCFSVPHRQDGSKSGPGGDLEPDA